jgi:hypothetical protein
VGGYNQPLHLLCQPILQLALNPISEWLTECSNSSQWKEVGALNLLFSDHQTIGLFLTMPMPRDGVQNPKEND